mmetsp:Transcript_92701/g.239970  ORF Transcript_92701/g.239970 Transcript_92701/m.239970 type:complete len:84 (+) Transcript_92701:50-301(+)|eukprot:CAMPEP_0115632984 /NCGR_PEP_ID=MMETSP0272-20121206/31806_1 /TAXON_ID=71861 /ORGANISM="Scrippsiella trochoidea, Strain CCMP3099" /LENGTH=83 /DNA_ID=CAMNT_0003069717 /DNA_START=73 /DNA_END=321 /DNA_ORIENTATION=-
MAQAGLERACVCWDVCCAHVACSSSMPLWRLQSPVGAKKQQRAARFGPWLDDASSLLASQRIRLAATGGRIAGGPTGGVTVCS